VSHDRPPTGRQLSLRERAFADAYARSGNGKASALSAGYTERGAAKAAFRLLRREAVTACITKIRSELSDSDAATPENLIERYRIAAMQAPLDYLVENPDGTMRLKRPSELTPTQRESVCDVKIRSVIDKVTGCARQEFSYIFESRRDARRALVRILGMNKDRLEVEHAGAVAVKALFRFVAQHPETSETRSRIRARYAPSPRPKEDADGPGQLSRLRPPR